MKRTAISLILTLFVGLGYPFSNIYGGSQDEDLNYTLGMAQFNKGAWRQATEHFLKVVEVNKSHRQALYFLGQSYLKRQQYTDAKKINSQLLALDAGNAEAHLQAGAIALETRQPKEAVMSLETAVKIQPGNGLAQYYLGLAYQGAGNFSASLSPLRAAAQLHPNLAGPAQYYQAVALHQGGASTDAVVLLEKLRHDSPNSVYAQRAASFIDSIEGKEAGGGNAFGVTLDLGVQYDSNVILEPSTIQVSEEDDFRGVGNFGMHLQSGSWNFLYNFYQSLHVELTDFNVQSHMGAIEFQRKISIHGRPTLLGLRTVHNVNFLSNDLDFFSRNHALEFFSNREVTSRYAVQFNLRGNLEAFRDLDEDRNYVGYGARMGHLLQLVREHLFVSLNTGMRFEDADREFDVVRFNGDSQLSWMLGAFNLTGNVGYERWMFYRNSLGREDNVLNAGVSFGLRPNPWGWRCGYQFTNADSNVAAYDYERSIVSINLLAAF